LPAFKVHKPAIIPEEVSHEDLGRLAGALVLALGRVCRTEWSAGGGGPQETANGFYKVLAPIESGNLLLFPVVRASGKFTSARLLSLWMRHQERSGEVTEAGRAQGMVRQRGLSAYRLIVATVYSLILITTTTIVATR